MNQPKQKRTAPEWIGYAFIIVGLSFLIVEVLQSLDVVQGWLDDPLTGAIATIFLGAALVMLAQKRKAGQSEVS